MTGVITTLKPVTRDEATGQKKGGFGFIRDEQDRDRFFHANDLRDVQFDDLKVKDAVEFVPTTGSARGNGLRAEQVRLAA